MGNQLKAKKIKNNIAKQFFIELRELYSKESQKKQKILVDIYKVLLRVPKEARSIALNFNNIKLGDQNALRIVKVLHNEKPITSFSLRNTRITNSTSNKIAELLKENSTIQQIDLSYNKIGLSGIRELSNVLSEHQNLNGLYLNHTNIGNDGAIILSDLIENNTNLEVLEIKSNEITSRGLGFIVEALKENYSIISLDVGKKDILDETELKRLSEYVERNSIANEVINLIISNSCQRQFRRKLTKFSKSVRGMEMLKGKTEQMNKTTRGTKLHELFEETGKKAKVDNVIDKKTEKGRWRVGFAEMMGRRETQEDVMVIKTNWLKDAGIEDYWTDNSGYWDNEKMKKVINNSNYEQDEEDENQEEIIKGELRNYQIENSEFFGLFDGHGGREASEHVANNLPVKIKDKLLKGIKIEEAIHDAFVELQEEMLSWCLYSGTTAIVIITLGAFVYVINLGDSKAVLCRNGFTVSLTQQQKPNDPEEKKRIEKDGGFVKDGRVNGILAVSRAFGDGYLGKAISCEPEIINFQISNSDSFIVIGCDGVWDVLSDKKTVGIVSGEIDPQKAAKRRSQTFEHSILRAAELQRRPIRVTEIKKNRLRSRTFLQLETPNQKQLHRAYDYNSQKDEPQKTHKKNAENIKNFLKEHRSYDHHNVFDNNNNQTNQKIQNDSQKEFPREKTTRSQGQEMKNMSRKTNDGEFNFNHVASRKTKENVNKSYSREKSLHNQTHDKKLLRKQKREKVNKLLERSKKTKNLIQKLTEKESAFNKNVRIEILELFAKTKNVKKLNSNLFTNLFLQNSKIQQPQTKTQAHPLIEIKIQKKIQIKNDPKDVQSFQNQIISQEEPKTKQTDLNEKLLKLIERSKRSKKKNKNAKFEKKFSQILTLINRAKELENLDTFKSKDLIIYNQTKLINTFHSKPIRTNTNKDSNYNNTANTDTSSKNSKLKKQITIEKLLDRANQPQKKNLQETNTKLIENNEQIKKIDPNSVHTNSYFKNIENIIQRTEQTLQNATESVIQELDKRKNSDNEYEKDKKKLLNLMKPRSELNFTVNNQGLYQYEYDTKKKKGEANDKGKDKGKGKGKGKDKEKDKQKEKENNIRNEMKLIQRQLEKKNKQKQAIMEKIEQTKINNKKKNQMITDIKNKNPLKKLTNISNEEKTIVNILKKIINQIFFTKEKFIETFYQYLTIMIQLNEKSSKEKRNSFKKINNILTKFSYAKLNNHMEKGIKKKLIKNLKNNQLNLIKNFHQTIINKKIEEYFQNNKLFLISNENFFYNLQQYLMDQLIEMKITKSRYKFLVIDFEKQIGFVRYEIMYYNILKRKMVLNIFNFLKNNQLIEISKGISTLNFDQNLNIKNKKKKKNQKKKKKKKKSRKEQVGYDVSFLKLIIKEKISMIINQQFSKKILTLPKFKEMVDFFNTIYQTNNLTFKKSNLVKIFKNSLSSTFSILFDQWIKSIGYSKKFKKIFSNNINKYQQFRNKSDNELKKYLKKNDLLQLILIIKYFLKNKKKNIKLVKKFTSNLFRFADNFGILLPLIFFITKTQIHLSKNCKQILKKNTILFHLLKEYCFSYGTEFLKNKFTKILNFICKDNIQLKNSKKKPDNDSVDVNANVNVNRKGNGNENANKNENENQKKNQTKNKMKNKNKKEKKKENKKKNENNSHDDNEKDRDNENDNANKETESNFSLILEKIFNSNEKYPLNICFICYKLKGLIQKRYPDDFYIIIKQFLFKIYFSIAIENPFQFSLINFPINKGLKKKLSNITKLLNSFINQKSNSTDIQSSHSEPTQKIMLLKLPLLQNLLQNFSKYNKKFKSTKFHKEFPNFYNSKSTNGEDLGKDFMVQIKPFLKINTEDNHNNVNNEDSGLLSDMKTLQRRLIDSNNKIIELNNEVSKISNFTLNPMKLKK
ncbi:phosphatase 2c [Anaeramoeba flamelloides]|uniref:Phosphatase 2c n=1 Tax=Anaeramoeba flamelloides TaxID=1746091 RepID=A0AAV7YB64_9EUKA|nr:phosphatase 2c [Anaeramoeba flamelloides]